MSRDWSEVKAICEKATPGPWEVAGCNGELTGIDGPFGYNHELESVIAQLEVWGGFDADLIAIARTALPEAIAEIEQLRQEKAELIEVLGMVADHLESTAKYAKLTDVVRAKAILTKFEGGEPNAKP